LKIATYIHGHTHVYGGTSPDQPDGSTVSDYVVLGSCTGVCGRLFDHRLSIPEGPLWVEGTAVEGANGRFCGNFIVRCRRSSESACEGEYWLLEVRLADFLEPAEFVSGARGLY
jgi:hypothetical protein